MFRLLRSLPLLLAKMVWGYRDKTMCPRMIVSSFGSPGRRGIVFLILSRSMVHTGILIGGRPTHPSAWPLPLTLALGGCPLPLSHILHPVLRLADLPAAPLMRALHRPSGFSPEDLLWLHSATHLLCNRKLSGISLKLGVKLKKKWWELCTGILSPKNVFQTRNPSSRDINVLECAYWHLPTRVQIIHWEM